jgi:hypothetical protein
MQSEALFKHSSARSRSRDSKRRPTLAGRPAARAPFLLLFALCILLGCFARSAFAEHFDIVYPRPSNLTDLRADYAKAVLALAMSEAHADYTIRMTHDVMERQRALRELAAGETINLHWTSMGEQDEANLRPIYVPIHRGLIGYRVLIIRKDRQREFDGIRTLDQLKPLIGGQGFGWVDVGILRHAGLHIDTSTYDTLFEMAEAGRIDYYPRGVAEAYAELEERAKTDPDLTVERHLLLAYRSDFLFYTNKRNERLAQAIERGLQAAYADGSFLRLFNTHPYIQQALLRADLAKRTVIPIENPYLSEADRAIPAAYWLSCCGEQGSGFPY